MLEVVQELDLAQRAHGIGQAIKNLANLLDRHIASRTHLPGSAICWKVAKFQHDNKLRPPNLYGTF